MNSNLACIGLDLDLDGMYELVNRIGPAAEVVGQVDGDLIHAWQDASGARLIFSIRDGELIDILPSFAAKTVWPTAGCRMINASVVNAGVFGPDGEQITAITFAPEQHRFLLRSQKPVDTTTQLLGLACDVEVFADGAEFGSSPMSLLTVDGPADGPRLGAGSFLSYGVWDGPDEADAHARIGGVVLSAEPRRNQATHQAFTVARVQVVDLELELCLPAEVPVPRPGQVVAGVLYLVGTITSVPYGADHPQSRWRRR